MNERIRKLVRTNTVAYILLLLLFAAVTAKISLALAIGEVAEGKDVSDPVIEEDEA